MVGVVDIGLSVLGAVVEAGGELDLAKGGDDPSHPADLGDDLGEGVLGGDCVTQDGGIERPFVPRADQSGSRHHLGHDVKDAVGGLGGGDLVPPQGEHIGGEPFVVERHSEGHLPVQVGPHLLHGLSVGEALQDLEHHDGGHPRGGYGGSPGAGGVEVGEVLICEELPAVIGEELIDRSGLEELGAEGLGVGQFGLDLFASQHGHILLDQD